MKVLRILTIFSVLLTTGLSAQSISDHALGLRLGDSDGFGAEISYQKSIARSNRVEVDLGWRDSRNFDAFKLTGIYQWVRILDGNFNWYYGVGGGLGSVDFDPGFPVDDDGGLFLFAAGDIVRGASLVVWAVRDGRDVAEKIDAYLVQQRNPSAAAA